MATVWRLGWSFLQVVLLLVVELTLSPDLASRLEIRGCRPETASQRSTKARCLRLGWGEAR
ncbi:uncharacterized protein CC84DRAFT_1163030 [Paraphaeosphaeria sporulosa]|uniref:Uncharacterized protein n=1 Tax=Paraphaeosphaeria sporulosa TaxID=1460663 RepID=A0A177CI95_9PLEO|nr:uncharacterized protein CC84DRAFT_1163030 [Paraphaeosphaeria sporulosa]OAG06702.1 hypothetical protein CC84DRAFT_1163030 [Paraphaeosphaeria sporulosa]